jgi:hypothetical protein
MRGAFGSSSHGHPGTHFGAHSGKSVFHRRGAGALAGYFGDYPFYDDYPLDQSAQNSDQPVPVLQPHVAGAPAAPKPTPLLIELEGDRYVRYGGTASSEHAPDRTPSRDPLARTPSGVAQPANVPTAQLAPTVLIYRDGHREQIPSYAIVGRTLYAPNSSDTAFTGDRANNHAQRTAQPAYGLRNIQLSALDIPATMNANRDNGVNFILPTSANEVVTRP